MTALSSNGRTPDFGSGYPGSSPGRATASLGAATPRGLPLAQFYDELYAQEETHWWHVGKHARVLAFLERFRRPADLPWRALDVGCGTGGFLTRLARGGIATGMDQAALALAYCRRRGHRQLIQHDVAGLPWPIRDEVFDVVTALDVVEHMDDAAACVREVARVLRPGGVAVVSVPSFQWLWGYWDEWQGHRRRYTRAQLVALLQQAGFRVVWASYADCATLLLIAPIRWWKHRQVRRGRAVTSDNAPPPPWANRVLCAYGRWETAWLRWGRLPWGTSVAAVVVKEATA